MKKVCLVVIFNHQYVKNVEKVEKIYSKRFDKIYHIMPFYRGDNPNIFSVYENSYQFEAYVTQALDKFYSEEYDYYAFMGDDVLLRPDLSKDTIEGILKINENTGFTARNLAVSNDAYLLSKIWLIPSILNYMYAEHKEQLESILPSVQDMVAKYKQLNMKCPLISEGKIKYLQDFGPINRRYSYYYKYHYPDEVMDYTKLLAAYKEPEGTAVKYVFPFACGFSDFFVIPKKFIKQFAYYAGVMATARVFAEVAVPTALCITCDHLTFPNTIGMIAVNHSATDSNRTEFPEKYSRSVKNVYNDWDNKNLLVHPIKFSMWEADIE